MSVQVGKKRRSSPRGNWIVIRYRKGVIEYITWVRTWAGAQMSKRKKERYIRKNEDGTVNTKDGRVLILDVERMVDFAATEGADEINDLYKLWEKS